MPEDANATTTVPVVFFSGGSAIAGRTGGGLGLMAEGHFLDHARHRQEVPA
jgi:hypothetical protein